MRFIDFLAAARQRWWQVLPLGPTSYRRLALPEPLDLRRQPAADQPRRAGRRRPARARRRRRAAGGDPARGRLRRGHRAQAAAAAPRARRRLSRRPRRRARGRLRALSRRARRRGSTTSRCSWRSRTRTAAPPGARWEPGRRAARAGGAGGCARRAWPARSPSTRRCSFCSSASGRRVRAARRGARHSHHRRPADLRRRTTAPTSGRTASSSSSTPTARRRVVAGVPPDYFSATGQLWGNPLYRWEVHDGARLRLVDRAPARRARAASTCVRLDHFIGFTRYWAVPARATDRGQRRAGVPAPGAAVLEAVARGARRRCRSSPRISAWSRRRSTRCATRFGFPGMHVLQFAFDGDAQQPRSCRTTTRANSVVYTGTHDNDTTAGWFHAAGPAVRHAALRYLGRRGAARRRRAISSAWRWRRSPTPPSCRCRTCSGSAATRA